MTTAPFKPHDIISFAGETYEVLQNFGRDGYVREYPAGQDHFRLHWTFQGESCVLVTPAEERMDGIRSPV